MTWRHCHWPAVREHLSQPQHRSSPWSLEDQMGMVWYLNPNAAGTVFVTVSKDQGWQLWAGTSGTVNGCVCAVSRGWVSPWPAGLYTSGTSSVMNTGSCAEIRWAQQRAEGSGDLWLVVSPGWLWEREDGARELALVPSDSLGFHFTYLKIKILGFWLFKTHLAAHGDF